MKPTDGFVFILKADRNAVNLEEKDLIMCKNCKHWKQVKKSVVGGLCYYHGQEFGPDDYCSYGDKEEK